MSVAVALTGGDPLAPHHHEVGVSPLTAPRVFSTLAPLRPLPTLALKPDPGHPAGLTALVSTTRREAIQTQPPVPAQIIEGHNDGDAQSRRIGETSSSWPCVGVMLSLTAGRRSVQRRASRPVQQHQRHHRAAQQDQTVEWPLSSPGVSTGRRSGRGHHHQAERWGVENCMDQRVVRRFSHDRQGSRGSRGETSHPELALPFVHRHQIR